MKLFKQVLILLLCCLLVRFTAQAESFGPTGQSSEQSPISPVQQSPQELQQLVAPIALYPDALVAQVLAASTYPAEIVEADRWMQSHSNLKGEELAKEVDKQPWDPSVKALTQFPSVLENMDKNLSWTSSLGDAYANQQQDVTDAVQGMRQQAHKTGHLNSNEQEKVTTQGNTIVIEPANPEIVYVPAYDPWLVYGEPIVAYPGWYPVPGIFLAGAGIGFGIGFGVGFFGGFGWGWHHWGCDWHGHRVIYNHNTYISPLTTTTRSTEADLAAEARGSTGLRLLTFSQEHAPARSVALTTVAMSEAFPPAGGRALEGVPMGVVFMAADDIGDRLHPAGRAYREFKNGEEYHAA